MIEVRKSEERGGADFGWLKSKHTFSFGQYYDPKHMGVSALRVINDDQVIPGAGFGTHPHRDMEIISFVTKGEIEHKDSMGNVQSLPAGEFQVMTAGTGVTHSEYNPSKSDSLEFLQIWVIPEKTNLEPGYQQKRFPEVNGLQLVISPDEANGALKMNQDASIYHYRQEEGQTDQANFGKDRLAYLHLVRGELAITDADGNQVTLTAGDGATVSGGQLDLGAQSNVEALVFDLPPH